jgi:Ca2+/Na+ antiporter
MDNQEIRIEIKERLDDFKTQIERFDNKAGSLIIGINIVFGIALYFMVIASLSSRSHLESHVFFIIITLIYFFAFFCCMFFLVSVIIPRGKVNEKNEHNINYYKAVCKMTEDGFLENMKLNLLDEKDLLKQIKIHAEICERKDRNLRRAIWMLVPLFSSILVMMLIGFVA